MKMKRMMVFIMMIVATMMLFSACPMISRILEEDPYAHSYWDKDIYDPNFEMIGIGYSNWVDGAYCGYKYDITNLSEEKTIYKMRIKTWAINDLSDLGNQAFTYSFYPYISPGETKYDIWIYVGDYTTSRNQKGYEVE